MKFEDQFKDEDAHDYVPKPKPNQPEPRRYPPRVRQPGPPEGQDYFTLSTIHGRPQGFFEKDKPR